MESISAIAKNRHLSILDLLDKQGNVKVEDLSVALSVSPVTIRRDLDYLNSKGVLIRTHGGASILQERKDSLIERKFIEKDIMNVYEKRKIAERAAELITDDATIFMNSGSTVLFFLRALRGKRVQVFTNNAAAISCERDPLVELFILGGHYRESSQSFVGEIAVNMMRGFFSDFTILSTNGISIDLGLTTSVQQECGINGAMIENTHGKVIALADSTKLGKSSNFVSSPLESVDILITDSKCPEAFKSELESRDIEVLVV